MQIFDNRNPPLFEKQILTLPRDLAVQIDGPRSSSRMYKIDCDMFELRAMRKRTTYIRSAARDEFDGHYPSNTPPPDLWLQIIRVGCIHYRLPIWRGNTPYNAHPTSDESIAQIAADCAMRDGHDIDQLQNNLLFKSNFRIR